MSWSIPGGGGSDQEKAGRAPAADGFVRYTPPMLHRLHGACRDGAGPARLRAFGVAHGTWLLALLAACGGKVVVDAPSGSGGGGAGGTGGTGTAPSTDGAGGTTASCPAQGVNPGAPCAEPGQTCVASLVCCEPFVTCVDGVWQISSTPSCDEPCPPCDPTTGLSCNGFAVCVMGNVAAIATYTCAPKPCGDAPFTCGCAQAVCAPGATCVSATEELVHCVGPTK